MTIRENLNPINESTFDLYNLDVDFMSRFNTGKNSENLSTSSEIVRQLEKNILKVFISLPMKGRSKAEIQEEILDIKEAFSKEIHKVFPEVNMVFLDSVPFDEIKDIPEGLAAKDALRGLSNSIGVLAEAEVVVFAPGWTSARGCDFEHRCALGYETERFFLPDNYKNIYSSRKS